MNFKAGGEDLPTRLRIAMGSKETHYERVKGLRYGTNPHQRAVLYRIVGGDQPSRGLTELQVGKGLSQTNIEDIDHAFSILRYFDEPSCAVMKHLNPSGVAVARRREESLRGIYARARDCDPLAAYGSVVGFNRPVDADTAEEIVSTFVEVVAAPAYLDTSPIFEGKEDMRVVQVSNLGRPRFLGDDKTHYEIDVLNDGSIILSEPFQTSIRSREDLKVVTQEKPTDRDYEDLLFSWYVCANVRSNGVVIAKDRATLAIGVGQQDRVTAVKIALEKAIDRGHGGELEGSVMASDGFIPFKDSIEIASKHGVRAVIQPGGSIRDREVIDACNLHGMAMVFTEERCFSHF
jgi:phosphoribosylaminoimidazolecarboxamide formyltransferase/IMP cyclohydrolase